MKRIFALALVLAGAFLFTPAASAQFTTITATVVDPNGIPYGAGTMSAVLVPGSSGGYTLSGQPYSGRVGPVTLDSTGKFTANFGDVTLIGPGSPQWKLTINSNQGGIEAPLGTGAQTFTFTSTGTTISGSSPVDISASLNALAPKLTNITIGAGTVTSVAATSPIVVTPSPITGVGTISCPTCTTSASTVPINNVVSATGPIATIADGNNPLVINCALTSGTTCLTTGETTAATTGGAVEHQITTLNKSTAIPLVISQGTAGPDGASAPLVLETFPVANGGAASGASNGLNGAGILLMTGNGSAAGGTGASTGNGGLFVIDLGRSSFNGCTLTTCNGGNAGGFHVQGNSGDKGGLTGNGGNASVFQFDTGIGGAGGATSGTGGVGSRFLFSGGSGGAATAGSTTGAGGGATFILGAAGGTGTPGAPGVFLIQGPSVLGSNTSPILKLTETWNTTGVVDAAIFLNITNTASGAGSELLDLQIGSTSQFSVDKSGNVLSGIDNSLAGIFQASNGSAAAHTLWGSAATTSNTIQGFATTPVSGNLVSCVSSGTTCTLTDSGIASTGSVRIASAVDLLAQSASVSGTLFTCPASPVTGGIYSLSYMMKVTQAATASSLLSVPTINFTDPDGTALTFNFPYAATGAMTVLTNTQDTGNSTANYDYGTTQTINCKASTAISYSNTYSSTGATSMQYELHFRLIGY